MQIPHLRALSERISEIPIVRPIGWVEGIEKGLLKVSHLETQATLGNRVMLEINGQDPVYGEVVRIRPDGVDILAEGNVEGVGLRAVVTLCPDLRIRPCDQWLGRIVNSCGIPLDGRPLLGGKPRTLQAPAPKAAQRHGLGGRLESGQSCFNTLLPIVSGQRIGLFAGSGVGKSMLLAHFARALQADVVVLALIGERGRELREFVEHTLGPEGMRRTVILAETSDQPALARRRCAWAALSVAEHFRDQGKQVLLLMDSVTRLAEAHREIALASGENAELQGFPPSTPHLLTALCERAGPGIGASGDITAIFSVLVAGSDMEGPIADILRGVLDGHVVLDREIAERGRFPAVDLLRSVSRALPKAADKGENDLILQARRLLGLYERSETMIRAGLYSMGSDPELDKAIAIWPELDRFLSQPETGGIKDSFTKLRLILRRVATGTAHSEPT